MLSASSNISVQDVPGDQVAANLILQTVNISKLVNVIIKEVFAFGITLAYNREAYIRDFTVSA